MPSRRSLGPFGLIAAGAVLVAVGLSSIAGEPVATALLWVGFPLVLVGALWYDVLDGRPLAELSRRDAAVGVLLFAGWGGYLVVSADLPLDRPVRVGVGVLAAVALLGVAYLRQHRDAVETYDERELQIRYRAAYNGFLALNAVLFLSAFVVYLSTMAPDDTGPTYATAVILGSVVVMAVGVLTLKVSEGWYQTRM